MVCLNVKYDVVYIMKIHKNEKMLTTSYDVEIKYII